MADMHAATELLNYINNEGALYERQTYPILKSLVAKRARGEYKHDLAVKAFGHLVESGAKKYTQEYEYGSSNPPWHKLFDASTRKQVAEALTRYFETEAALGNYDYLLPKKYQGQKKAKEPAPKKVSTSSLVVNLGRGRVRKARLANLRRKAAGLPLIEITTAQDIREFRGFLRNASDSQVQGIYEKEKGAGRDEYAELAVAEADRRGISLGGRHNHASRRGVTDRPVVKRGVRGIYEVLWYDTGAGVVRSLVNRTVVAKYTPGLGWEDHGRLPDSVREYAQQIASGVAPHHETSHAQIKRQLDHDIAQALGPQAFSSLYRRRR